MESSTNFSGIDKAMQLLLTSVFLIFSLLATVVLLFYIRRRYNLWKEIKGISSEKLWYPSYINHLKNLKIKAMISNFIIIITSVEIVNNTANLVILSEQLFNSNNQIFILIFSQVRLISQLGYVPLLCLLLNVLWHAYLHSPYKYIIMRWTVYIVLRSIAAITVYQVVNLTVFSGIESLVDLSLYSLMLCIFTTLDLIVYVLYSRRFYLHLKSRELEAKLFMDRRKYLENKYTRFHFKVATILVAAALFMYNIINIINTIFIVVTYIIYIYFPETFTNEWSFLEQVVDILPMELSQLIFRILLSLNYLYVLIIILHKYCKRYSHKRVNDKIRPLVRNYQEEIFSRQNYRYY